MDIRPYSRSIYRFVFWTGVVALIGSFWLGIHAWPYQLGDSKAPGSFWVKLKITVLLVWTVLPPILFWFEYFTLYRELWQGYRETPPDFDEFRYGQEISSKVWLAVSTALLILYFGKDLKH